MYKLEQIQQKLNKLIFNKERLQNWGTSKIKSLQYYESNEYIAELAVI